MTTFRQMLIGATAAFLTSYGAADAQQAARCSDRQRVVARLAEGYGETRQSIGLGADNSVIEVFASDDTGTWTILMTLPTGESCLVATGNAFEVLVSEPPAVLDQDA